MTGASDGVGNGADLDPQAYLDAVVALLEAAGHRAPRSDVADAEAALRTMPRRQRDVFLLHSVDGLSYAEIALQLGISRRRVERAMRRALRHLRRRPVPLGERVRLWLGWP